MTDKLDDWKQIANYLGRSVKRVQRWQDQAGRHFQYVCEEVLQAPAGSGDRLQYPSTNLRQIIGWRRQQKLGRARA